MQTARPYDFDEFADDADAPAPDAAYSATDLEAARETARAEALESKIAAETAEQTRLLAAIAERLEAAARLRDDAIAAQAAELVAIARDIVKEICIAAIARDKGESALALAERYLTAAPDMAPATLVLSDVTPESVIASIRKALAGRGASKSVKVETSPDFAPGDCRIAWRDGAMARELKDILAQIETIFAGVQNDAAQPRSPKEKKS